MNNMNHLIVRVTKIAQQKVNIKRLAYDISYEHHDHVDGLKSWAYVKI